MTHRDMGGPCFPPFPGMPGHWGREHGHRPPFRHFPPFLPALHSVHEDGEEVTIAVPVPGFGKEEVDVTLKGHLLVVKGHREGATEATSENAPEEGDAEPKGSDAGPEEEPEFYGGFGHLLRKFMPAWDVWNQDKFEFAVPLPPFVDSDGPVKAQVQKGLLKVTFQKRQSKEVPVE